MTANDARTFENAEIDCPKSIDKNFQLNAKVADIPHMRLIKAPKENM